MNKIPEKCKLVAIHTGDGWSLEVYQNIGDNEELVAYLDWPESWPNYVTTEDLQNSGFEVW